MNWRGSVAVMALFAVHAELASAVPIGPVDPPAVSKIGLPGSAPSIPPLPQLPEIPTAPSVPSLPPSPASTTEIAESRIGPHRSSPSISSATRQADASAPRAIGPTDTGRTSSSENEVDSPAGPDTRRQSAIRRQRVQGRRDRRLRRTVLRLRTCLGALPELQERVVALRAGLGRPHPASRPEVARQLELTERRTSRVERRALRRLRSLERQNRCDGLSVPSNSDTDVADAVFNAVADVASDGFVDSAVAAQPPEGEEGRTPRSRDRAKVKAERAQSAPLARLIPISREGVDVTLPLLVAVAAGGWLVLRRRTRRA